MPFLRSVCLTILLVNPLLLNGQENLSNFDRQLQQTINESQIRYQLEDINQEQFLIQLMRHVASSIKMIRPDYRQRRVQYFLDLQNYQQSLAQLDPTLRANGASSAVLQYSARAQATVKDLIDRSEFSYKTANVVKDALALLNQINAKLSSGGDVAVETDQLKRKLYPQEATVSTSTTNSGQRNASLLNVIEEWERTEIVKYKLKLDQLRYFQQQLMKKANASQRVQIARDLFRRGLILFNSGRYEAADLLFGNLLNEYDFLRNKYLVQYYQGITNYYLNRYKEADKLLSPLLTSPKGDQYLGIVLAKIYVNLDDMKRFEQLANLFPRLSSTTNYTNDFNFIAAKYFHAKSQYQNAANFAGKLSSEHPLYYDARFTRAASLYKVNPQQSKTEFINLINADDITIDIRHEALLRLAYIEFQEKGYGQAIKYFQEINAADYYGYDRVVLGIAWCQYEIQMQRKNPNFSNVVNILNEFLRVYPNSELHNEARALLGYVKQKSDNLDGAEEEFQHVFEAKAYKLRSDEYQSEMDSLKHLRREIDNLTEKALLKRNRSVFKRLDDLKYNVDKKIYRLRYMDASSLKPSGEQEVQRVMRQINEFERLKKIAEQKNDPVIMRRIDDNLVRLYAVMNQFQVADTTSLFGVNFFADQKLARTVSLTEYQNNRYQEIGNQADSAYQRIQTKIAESRRAYDQAKQAKDYKKMTQIDITLYKLYKTLSRMDYLNTVANAYNPRKSSSNLDKWANYGAYQLTNIQYAQRQKLLEQNRLSDETISQLNALMEDRNIYLAEQIKQIENNIYNMTRRETRRRRIEERNKQKQFYETQFFDTTRTEINEDSIRLALERKSRQRMQLRKSAFVIKKDSATTDSMSTDSTATDSLNQIKQPADTNQQQNDGDTQEDNQNDNGRREDD